jgi:hypothetical protein
VSVVSLSGPFTTARTSALTIGTGRASGLSTTRSTGPSGGAGGRAGGASCWAAANPDTSNTDAAAARAGRNARMADLIHG